MFGAAQWEWGVRTSGEVDPDEGLESLDVLAPCARVGVLCADVGISLRLLRSLWGTLPAGTEEHGMGMFCQREVEKILNARAGWDA